MLLLRFTSSRWYAIRALLTRAPQIRIGYLANPHSAVEKELSRLAHNEEIVRANRTGAIWLDH